MPGVVTLVSPNIPAIASNLAPPTRVQVAHECRKAWQETPSALSPRSVRCLSSVSFVQSEVKVLGLLRKHNFS